MTTILQAIAVIGIALLVATPAEAKPRSVPHGGAHAPAKPMRPIDVYQAEQAMTPTQLIARWQPMSARPRGAPMCRWPGSTQ